MRNLFFRAEIVFLFILMGQAVDAVESNVLLPENLGGKRIAAPLPAYLIKEDSSYHWEQIREGEIGGVEYVELILTSQTWRDIVWKHRLFIIKPDELAANSHAMLIIAGGKWKEQYEDPSFTDTPGKEAVLFANLAKQLASPIAVLLQVPQQPIFDGMVEDEIISYTFEKFLDTEDSEWPLLLPMVKSAVKGMDAVQEFCQEQWSLPIQSFTVTGASKRGWTTWLAGASDPRITAIAPMVIDTLNLRPQLEHQFEAWGELSAEIHDYIERDIPQRMGSPAGEELLQIVDPLSYRDSLKLPKLMILGTNDRYWTLDALNLYWAQLLGPKYILYVPNNGHGLKDYPRILGGVLALLEEAKGGEKMPNLNWSFDETNGHVTLAISSDVPPTDCQLWSARSKTKDFRDSHWTATEIVRNGDKFIADVKVPDTGAIAFLGEACFDRKNLPLYLSTNVRILFSDELEGTGE